MDVAFQVNDKSRTALGYLRFQRRKLMLGSEIIGTTPEQFAAIITNDTAKWDKVIKAAGIKID